MATYRPSKPPDPISVNRWLGTNEAVGQTGLKLGEALRQVNYRITKDYKPKKREGHNSWIDFGNVKDVRGTWKGKIGSKTSFIAINDGKVYERDLSITTTSTVIADLITDLAVVELGTITDAPTAIFFFESKLYFINGADYKEYDGTTFQDAVPYEPTKYIALAPDLAGFNEANINEQENLLTGRKWFEFVGDGVKTEYILPEAPNLDAELVLCYIDGVEKIETVAFTVDRTVPKMTFTVAPLDEELVRVRVRKDTATHANLVKKNKYAMKFGVDSATSIFMWGHPDFINTRRWSSPLNASYFPVTNFTNIGTNDSAITDIKTNNANYQIIFKEGRTHYSYGEYILATETWDYPVKDLRDDVGNEVYNGVQIVNNSPVSIQSKSWWQWTSTTIEDERNADVISERLRTSLSDIDLSTAITFDYQSEKEYWCNVGDMVYIWNYGNDTMYAFDNISATNFLDIDGVVYYGSNGTVERMDGTNDNGVEVVAQIDTGHNSYGAIHMIKSSDMIYIGLLPDSRTSVMVYFRTNKKTEWKQISKVAEYVLIDFDNIDFDDFSFLTNRNPQTFALPFTSGDYTYIQYRFENAELDETCVILDFLVNAEIQGEI